MWKWYIVILVSEDYYILYQGYKIVKARSFQEAKRKIMKKESFYVRVMDAFGPFNEKPGEYIYATS